MSDTPAEERKPRSRALINPSKAEMAGRHVGRIGRLRIAIEEAVAEGNTERVAALQAELDRRLIEVAEIKAELDNI